MISKKKRLTTSRVEYVLKKGARFGSSKFFSIKFVPSKRSESRFCVMVSTKIASSAVDRNHLRRQVYEAVRLSPGETKKTLSKNFDIIFMAKPALKEIDYPTIQKEIENILKAIHEEK